MAQAAPLTALHHPLIGEAASARSARRWAVVGVATLLLTFGGAALWSATVPLASAVVAQGVVKVESNRKKIQHAEGGVVLEIRVKDGDKVKAGDVLVRMDPARASSANGVIETDRDTALAALARLAAERDELASIEYPAALRTRAKDPQIAELLRAQDNQFKARRDARRGEVEILDQQIEASRGEIKGLESQERARSVQLESLAHDLQAMQSLDAEGLIEKTKVRAIERDLARLKGEEDEAKAKISAARATIHEREFRKAQVRKSFQEDVGAEIRKVQAELAGLGERATATRRSLQLTDIRSPVSGTVTELKVHTPSGVVAPGEVLMEIVPAADQLSIEAKVLPHDIDRVAQGQSAGVKIHAFNSRTTSELNGSVAYVAADATVDPRTELGYYAVRVTIAPDEFKRLNPGEILQPGMQSDLYIRTGEKTFVAYLIQPLTDSFRRAWRER